MPRYFFDIQDGFYHRDEIGREIGDRRELRREAMRLVNQLAAKEGEDSDGYSIMVSVRDAAGVNVLTLRNVCQIDEPEAQSLRIAS